MGDEAGRGTLRPEVRWGVGCLIGALSMIGVLLLVFLIALFGDVPSWLQVVIGTLLAIGGAAFAWLISSALAQSKIDRAAQPPPTREEELPER